MGSLAQMTQLTGKLTTTQSEAISTLTTYPRALVALKLDPVNVLCNTVLLKLDV